MSKVVCSHNKITYTSREDALSFLKSSNVSKDKRCHKVYHCPACDGWHVTSSKNKKLKNERITNIQIDTRTIKQNTTENLKIRQFNFKIK